MPSVRSSWVRSAGLSLKSFVNIYSMLERRPAKRGFGFCTGESKSI